MAWLDRRGRLWGKVSVLDVGAIAVLVMAAIAFFWLPTKGGASVAQLASANQQPVEFEIMVRGLTVLRPNSLLKVGDRPNLMVRNQPRGQVEVKAVTVLVPRIPVPTLDGKVTVVPDPRLAELYVRDFAVTLTATATVTNDGLVVGGDKLKIGTPVDLEGPRYVMRGSVMDVRF
ncbi:MAG: DUF4330 domain-containing protein [Oscillatoriales cyanobacterium SM2_1_8]|nr:DUF4330 domain-containing protein [Oscillatoriales cyanobacterium SM2_1_8]